MKTYDSKETKKGIAHLFEDPETGRLWMTTYTYDERGFVKTANGELDLAKFRVIDAEIVSYHHFGLCIASPDFIAVKNNNNMYAVLTPYHDSMGHGADYASISQGFEYQSVYGFGFNFPNEQTADYIVAQNAEGKWGLIKISHSGNMWFDYDACPFSQLQELVFFDKECMDDILKDFVMATPVFSMLYMPNIKGRGFIRNLTEYNIPEHEEGEWGISLDMMLNARDIHNQMYRTTPDKITYLKTNEVFVFGSNLEGAHGGGAARLAYEKFGAEWGVGVGPTGQCYAIPTMQGGVEAIKPYVDDFITYAKQHPENVFYVTRIGCGTAGFKDEEIAPLFAAARNLNNVALPAGWR